MRAAIVGLLFLSGCSAFAPEHRVFADMSDEEVARVQGVLGQDTRPEMIREDRIDFSAEVTVPCSEMLSICYGGMHPLWIALGSVPLACTKFWVGADRDALGYVVGLWKTAVAYGCSLTPEWAWEHERRHLKGMGHL